MSCLRVCCFLPALPVILMGERAWGAETSPQPAGSGLPPFVCCAVSHCLSLYLLEHTPEVALNVWGMIFGVIKVYPLQSSVLAVLLRG